MNSVETAGWQQGAAAALTDAAARAGAAIMRHYRTPAEVELKADASPVTCADREAEAILLDALRSFAPEIPVVSEETAERPERLGSRFFLVDPLDGTKEFVTQRTDFTVNVALIENGCPRFGLVYAPALSLLALTIQDRAAVEAVLPPSAEGADLAQLDLKPLRARLPARDGLIAVVSHSHLDQATDDFLSKLTIKGRSSAGSSLKFLQIARGEADVYPRFGPTMEWDTAAGQAVLEAAGGEVVDLVGKPFRYGKTEAGLKNPGFIAWGLRSGAAAASE